MPIVDVRQGEPIDKAIRRLSKIVSKEGIIQTVKRNQYYEKPSTKKRREKIRVIKKIQKELRLREF